VYTLHNSQQLSLFSSTEGCCSNSATTAATNSYGVPCHYSLTGAAPLSNTKLTNCWTRNSLSHQLPLALNYIARERTTKKTPPKVPLLLHGLPIVACLFVLCLATVVNKRLLIADLGPLLSNGRKQAFMSQYFAVKLV
jgi:hypothetical protein